MDSTDDRYLPILGFKDTLKNNNGNHAIDAFYIRYKFFHY